LEGVPVNGKDSKLLSSAEAAILGLLAGRQMCGSEMVRASECLNRGSIYVILNRMEDAGLILSRPLESTGPTAGKLTYAITGSGQDAYAAWERESRPMRPLYKTLLYYTIGLALALAVLRVLFPETAKIIIGVVANY
jgi:DNA-binding PadR family transcriptional regulator